VVTIPRALRLVAVGVVLALVAAVVGVEVYAANAEAIAFGNAWVVQGAEETDEPSADGAGRTTYHFRFAERREARWGVEVRNALRVPLRILGRHAFPVASVVGDDRLYLPVDDSFGVEDDQVRPFASVDLGPGERVFLVMAQRFIDCKTARQSYSAGTAVGPGLLLDIEVLGLERVVLVDLPFDVFFDAPLESDC
jgi:hypothetical protein